MRRTITFLKKLFVTLYIVADRRQVTLSDLSNELGLRKTTLLPLVNVMRHLGLVTAKYKKGPGRGILVIRPTEAGLRLGLTLVHDPELKTLVARWREGE